MSTNGLTPLDLSLGLRALKESQRPDGTFAERLQAARMRFMAGKLCPSTPSDPATRPKTRIAGAQWDRMQAAKARVIAHEAGSYSPAKPFVPSDPSTMSDEELRARVEAIRKGEGQ